MYSQFFNIYGLKIRFTLIFMKTIFLIRHAKSSWATVGQRDIERPLEKRGLDDAPRMASHLKKLGIKPDLLVSSPAVRARTTAEFFATAFNIPSQNIDSQQDIYEADERTILHIIHELPDAVDTVFLFGHNPTFTYVADSFSKRDRFENVPTCGIVRIQSNTEGVSWANFTIKTAEVTGYWYPKGI
jgi:phosphohistidine phosphatase